MARAKTPLDPLFPPWLTPVHVATGALALVVGVAAAATLSAGVVVYGYFAARSNAVAAALLVATLIGLVFARVAISRGRLTDGWLRPTLVWTALAVVCGPAVVATYAFLADAVPFVSHAPPVLLMIALIFAIPFGIALAAIASPTVRAAVAWRDAPTLDAADEVAFAAGVTAACLGLLTASTSGASAGVAVLGLGVATAAARRLVGRAHFIARVRAGAEPAFRVAPREHHPDERGLPSLARVSPFVDGVLIAVGQGSAHRGERGHRPFALVSLDAEPSPWERLVKPALWQVVVVVVSLAAAALLAGGVLMGGMLAAFARLGDLD